MCTCLCAYHRTVGLITPICICIGPIYSARIIVWSFYILYNLWVTGIIIVAEVALMSNMTNQLISQYYCYFNGSITIISHTDVYLISCNIIMSNPYNQDVLPIHAYVIVPLFYSVTVDINIFVVVYLMCNTQLFKSITLIHKVYI